MEKLSNLFLSFFENIEDFRAKISPLSKRSGLTADEALCLIAIYKFPNTKLFCEEICSSLCSAGFIESTDSGFKTTGKGAILAKSLWIGFDK